ncbi:unnamed protein product [marine sediment metagenome]|uniref:HEPN domain-containing protein n=1 Tax=marine sediment metagenome TaxID=412755 RepID=X1H458_9ZZZZ
MDWTDCLNHNKVKQVQKNPEQANSLVKLAERRFESIEKRKDYEYPQLLLEDYYETIKELISALLAAHGYKSYSHECLISFMREFYPHALTESQLHFLDDLRRLRSDILYRGRDVAEDYLHRNSSGIERILELLFEKAR